MLKAIRNVVVRTVVISAVVLGISFGSYYICKGLSWLTTQLTTWFDTFGAFVKGNWVSLVVVIVVVTIANVLFEILSKKVSRKSHHQDE